MDLWTGTFSFGLLALLIGLSAFFSGSETGFSSLSRLHRLKLREEGSKHMLYHLAHPQEILITILVGNMIVNLFASSFAAGICFRIFGKPGIFLSTAVMTFLILIFGEIAPKTFAAQDPERFVRHAAFPLHLFSKVILPVREALRYLARWVLPVSREKRAGMSEVDLRAAVQVGHGEGVLAPSERKIMNNILDLDRVVVREVMTPRMEMFTIEAGRPLEEIILRVKEKDYSRIPVYQGSEEHVIGLVHIRDILAAKTALHQDWDSRIRPVDFIPETKRVVDLLREMQSRRTQAAVVIDEYGSLAGFVTLEDILERIVGQIVDHREDLGEAFRVLGRHRMHLSARTEIERFNDLFHAQVPHGEFETIGGWILAQIGRIPTVGEQFHFGNLDVTILRADPKRILEIEVRKKSGPENAK
ncbi:MAG: hemolysin family protein [Candidatus Latescibacterota bacterium]